MDKLKQWVALTVVAVLAVAAGGWVLLISPKRADASDLRQQAATQYGTNAQLRTQIQVLKAQAVGVPGEQSKIAAIGVKIPGTTQQPELLRALSAAAETAGVELVSVAPGAVVGVVTGTPAVPGATAVVPSPAATATASSPVGSTTVSPSSAAGHLSAMPITVIVAGGYFEAEKYLATIEDLPRAFRVTGLTIAPGASPTVSSTVTPNLEDGQHLLTTITGMVYVAEGAQPLLPATTTATPTK